MAFLHSCCFWRSVRKGSYASSIYTLAYFGTSCIIVSIFLQEERQYLSGEIERPAGESFLEKEKISSTTVIFNILLLICASCGVIASILVIIGLKTDQRELLLPWILIMIGDIFIEISHFIYLILIQTLVFEPLTATLFTIDFFIMCLNIYCLLCVISQYQEYKVGRGGGADSRNDVVKHNVNYTPPSPTHHHVTSTQVTGSSTNNNNNNNNNHHHHHHHHHHQQQQQHSHVKLCQYKHCQNICEIQETTETDPANENDILGTKLKLNNNNNNSINSNNNNIHNSNSNSCSNSENKTKLIDKTNSSKIKSSTNKFVNCKNFKNSLSKKQGSGSSGGGKKHVKFPDEIKCSYSDTSILDEHNNLSTNSFNSNLTNEGEYDEQMNSCNSNETSDVVINVPDKEYNDASCTITITTPRI